MIPLYAGIYLVVVLGTTRFEVWPLHKLKKKFLWHNTGGFVVNFEWNVHVRNTDMKMSSKMLSFPQNFTIQSIGGDPV